MENVSLISLLESSVAQWPDRIFLDDGKRALSYKDVYVLVNKLSQHLGALGVEPWDRVAIVSRNSHSVILALLACNAVGAIPAVLNDKNTEKTLSKIQCSMEAKVVFLDDSTIPRRLCFPGSEIIQIESIAEIIESYSEAAAFKGKGISTDPALMIYTSGSTGEPKGIVLSNDNVLFASQKIQERLNYQADDSIGLFLPLSFDYGLYQAFLAAQVGARLVIYDANSAGPALVNTLKQGGITVFPGVPHLFSMLTKFLSRRDMALPKIRVCTNTGAHLPASQIDLLNKFLPNARVYPMYGLTECKRISILTPEEAAERPNSVGRPLDDTEVLVVNKKGVPVGPGEVGELVVSGRHLALGYWKSDEENALRYRNHPKGIGRALYTGDEFKKDADGYLYYIGRSDDQIKRNGFRIHRLEIENAAMEISGVQTACVVQTANNELVLAVCMNDQGISESDVLSELASVLEPYKVPDRVVFQESIPISANGKTDRKRVREIIA
ncbi:class I adenylate-forming enzyme family protein [Pseudomonadota bacterium]